MKDSELPTIPDEKASPGYPVRAVRFVGTLLNTRLNRTCCLAFLVGALFLASLGTLWGIAAGRRHADAVIQASRWVEQEAYWNGRIAEMEGRIALLSDEVAARQEVYRKMTAILEAYGTDIPAVERQDFVRFVYHESMKNDLDPIMAMAVIKVESTFETTAVSPVGAMGLMQILPYVGRHVARELGIAWRGNETLYDPYVNVRIGISYLVELSRQFNDFSLALEAYNRGPTALRATMTAGIRPSTLYARRVMSAYSRFMRI